jgi:hypothetical protein
VGRTEAIKNGTNKPSRAVQPFVAFGWGTNNAHHFWVSVELDAAMSGVALATKRMSSRAAARSSKGKPTKWR